MTVPRGRVMMLMVGALAALTLSAPAAWPGRARAESETAAAVATSPEGAVREAVEAAGDAYAGDCAATVSPRDLGKVCSRFEAEQDGMRAYLVGRTFSEFTRWVFVAQAAGGWRITGAAPLDIFGPPSPPWP